MNILFDSYTIPKDKVIYMRAVILGRGKMGKMLESILVKQGFEVLGFLTEENYEELSHTAQVLFDFSHTSKLVLLDKFLSLCNCSVIIGTTGYSKEQYTLLQYFGRTHRVCYSSNYSTGIQVMNRMVQIVLPYVMHEYDIEIIEAHHRYKQDAPSGTVQLFLDTIKRNDTFTEVYGRCGMVGKREREEIGVHSVRGGTHIGTHHIYFMGDNEEIMITHHTLDKAVYAYGAIQAWELLEKRECGFFEYQELLFQGE